MKRTEEKEIFPIVYRKYSDAELKKFHDLVQKFYYDHTTVFSKPIGEVIRILDKKKLMIAFGAITPDERVITEGEFFQPPNRLQKFDNLYEQWQAWKLRNGMDKGSWKHQELESLEKVAEQMKIKI